MFPASDEKVVLVLPLIVVSAKTQNLLGDKLAVRSDFVEAIEDDDQLSRVKRRSNEIVRARKMVISERRYECLLYCLLLLREISEDDEYRDQMVKVIMAAFFYDANDEALHECCFTCPRPS